MSGDMRIDGAAENGAQPKVKSYGSLLAFSLVEVVVALGIVSFVVISIIGLFTVGLTGVRDSQEQIDAANVASLLMERRLQAPEASIPGFPLPAINPDVLPTTPPAYQSGIFIDRSGMVSNNSSSNVYLLTYRVWKDAQWAGSPFGPLVRVNLILSSPPDAPLRQAANYYEMGGSYFAK